MNSGNLDYIDRPDNAELEHIPGDFGVPIMGNVIACLNDQLAFARERYQKYGPISSMKMGPQKGILALGPDVAREIFVDKDQVYSSKMGYKWSLNPYFGENFLLGNDFDEHKFQRRVMQTGFRADSMAGYVELMNPVMAEAMKDWGELDTFVVYTRVKTLLMTTALKVFYGIDPNSNLSSDLSQAFIDLTEGMIGLFRVDVPGFNYHKAMKASRKLRAFLASLIPAARKEHRKDMMSYMAKETKPDGSFFTDEELVDHAGFLLFAAHDTTTSTLNHLFYYMAKYPEWQETLRAEGEAVNGGQPVSYEDLGKLEIFEQAFWEANRLHPSVPIAVRRNIRDCELVGHHIPADTLIFQFPAFANRMSEYWTDPDTFDPNRWSPERAEQTNHPFCFMPFGGGAHKCIGQHFALMQGKLMMQQFLKQYRVKLKPGYKADFVTIPLPKVKDNLPLIIERI